MVIILGNPDESAEASIYPQFPSTVDVRLHHIRDGDTTKGVVGEIEHYWEQTTSSDSMANRLTS